VQKVPQLGKEVSRIEAYLLGGDFSTFKKKANPEKLEVVDLDFDANGGCKGIFRFQIGNTHKALNIWNSLEGDDPARCFTPGYALYFYEGEREVMRAALCWMCDLMQIKFQNKEQSTWLPFDGESPQAQNLLQLLRDDCHKHI
jgi:hypothetical protein